MKKTPPKAPPQTVPDTSVKTVLKTVPDTSEQTGSRTTLTTGSAKSLRCVDPEVSGTEVSGTEVSGTECGVSGTGFEFPCDFPLKVMGRDTARFRAAVLGIVRQHAPDASEPETRTSSGGRYISLSFLLRAESRAQLEALYRELSASEEVLWAL